MVKTRSDKTLREPGFLLWLSQFVGEWNLDGPIDIRRRNDGFLEVFSVNRSKKISLSSVLQQGELIKPAQSPLGPYPVILSMPLMEHWLNSEDLKNLNGAWNVGSGIQKILKTIEKRIKEMPLSKRKQRWLAWWDANIQSEPPLSNEDKAAHKSLYHRYLSDSK